MNCLAILSGKETPHKTKALTYSCEHVENGGVEEKSSSGKKFESPKKSNFFPQFFFWFIWKQRCYNNGRPLILKPVPNEEE